MNKNEKEFDVQVKDGERFEFGKNWEAFLKTLNEERINTSKASLLSLLGDYNLKDKTFLDIGSGSGLFSLSAKNLGAKVQSMDFDTYSVKCTKFLRDKYYSNDKSWEVKQGSVLDKTFMSSFPKFDVVYSWGVLHHTGNMNLALENATIPVKENGLLIIAIYNDEGFKSRRWLKVKKIYNSSFFGKAAVISFYFTLFTLKSIFNDLKKLKGPFYTFRTYKKNRGMSITHDWIDWLGGLPFEVASPEYIFDFYKERGFRLEKMTTKSSSGNNQFVFRRMSPL
jgi:2-polyprenyl-6-hydroxyphenyl methylase/3-demethylubiquinone-9 3-methyltransferase